MTSRVKTITIQIGNSDDKLSQVKWSAFVDEMSTCIRRHCFTIHFFGAPANWTPWQNAAWIVSVTPESIADLKEAVQKVRAKYNQDSAAWTEGVTQFI